MKHEIHHKGTPVQAYKHPTPMDIRSAIIDALHADDIAHPDNMMPARTYRVVNEAITRACNGGAA